MFVTEPCAAVFSGMTGCGKTERVLKLLQSDYHNHFEYIVILCPTLKWNKTYLNCEPLWSDDSVFLIDPKDQLLTYIEKFSNIFAGDLALFIIDDCIADKELDKRRQALLDLAISGRHRQHSLWLLTQSYTAIPKNLRRQCKMLFIWYPKERSDMRQIDEETNLIDDWKPVIEDLKKSKHACLYIRVEHPRSFTIL